MTKGINKALLDLANSGASEQRIKDFIEGIKLGAFEFGRPGVSEDFEEWANEHTVENGKIVRC